MNKGLGIYFHIPYCNTKCFYCDFYSIVNLETKETYVDYLAKEINMQCKSLLNDKLKPDTIYFGGGTPSLLKPHTFEKIFTELTQYFDLSLVKEITVECNPGTVSVEYFKDLKRIGINRISIGIQSFNPDELKFLQRIHTVNEARQAFLDARKAGFDNISLDLIFSLPNQELNSWKYTLENAIELEPNNISAYSLIFEPKTPLYNQFLKGKIKPIDEEKDSEQYEFTIDYLTNKDYLQYEVSNFAKSGFECLHHLIYWRHGNYFGFGPSAHGFINNSRYKNLSNLRKYFQLIDDNKLPLEFTENLTVKELLSERIFLGLRSEGIDLNEFFSDFGVNLEEEAGILFKNWQELKFIQRDENKIRFTKTGYMLCDELTVELLKLLDENC